MLPVSFRTVDGGPPEDGLPGQGQMNPMANPLNLRLRQRTLCERRGSSGAGHPLTTIGPRTRATCIPSQNQCRSQWGHASAGRTPDDAVAERVLLAAEDCSAYQLHPRGDGFGPPVMVRPPGQQHRLSPCACNNQVIDDPKCNVGSNLSGPTSPAPIVAAGPGRSGRSHGWAGAPPRRPLLQPVTHPAPLLYSTYRLTSPDSKVHPMNTVDSYQSMMKLTPNGAFRFNAGGWHSHRPCR